MLLSDRIIDIAARAFHFLDDDFDMRFLLILTSKIAAERFRKFFLKNVLQKSRRCVQLVFDKRFKPLLCLLCSTFGML